MASMDTEVSKNLGPIEASVSELTGEPVEEYGNLNSQTRPVAS